MPPKTDLPLTYSDDLIGLDQYTAKDVENHLAGKSLPTPSTISVGPCPLSLALTSLGSGPPAPARRCEFPLCFPV